MYYIMMIITYQLRLPIKIGRYRLFLTCKHQEINIQIIQKGVLVYITSNYSKQRSNYDGVRQIMLTTTTTTT